MPVQDEYVMEILRDVGLISYDDLQKAKETAEANGTGLVKALIQMGRVTQMDVSKALAGQFGMDTINLSEYRVPEDIIA